MSDIDISFSIRNILLLQFLTLLVVREPAFQLCQKLLKVWKSLRAPFLSRKHPSRGKKGKFWEVDMTKFEP